jgi:hypothetical protein
MRWRIGNAFCDDEVVVPSSEPMLTCSWYAGFSYQARTASMVGNWMIATPSTSGPSFTSHLPAPGQKRTRMAGYEDRRLLGVQVQFALIPRPRLRDEDECCHEPPPCRKPDPTVADYISSTFSDRPLVARVAVVVATERRTWTSSWLTLRARKFPGRHGEARGPLRNRS